MPEGQLATIGEHLESAETVMANNHKQTYRVQNTPMGITLEFVIQLCW